MKHNPSKVKVYMTSDYKLFVNVDGNRPLNKKKIERIISEINSGNDILDEVPALVKEVKNKLEVLDGQHRVEIARQLGRPVHYILHKQQMTLHNVAKVNSNVEKWSDKNFINCYIKTGNNNYKKLLQFHNEYGIAIGICITMLTRGGEPRDGGHSQFEKVRLSFEQGLFEIKTWKEAVQMAEIAKNFSEFKSWNGRPFLIAISKIVNAQKCEMDVLIKKFKSDPTRLQNHSNWKLFLTNLEEIYNKGNMNRRTIF